MKDYYDEYKNIVFQQEYQEDHSYRYGNAFSSGVSASILVKQYLGYGLEKLKRSYDKASTSSSTSAKYVGK